MAKRKRKSELPPPSTPPVRPGLIGPARPVPRDIPRPPYALSGDPGSSVSSVVRSPAEIDAMRAAGAAAAEILLHAAKVVAPGVTTDKIDEVVHEETIKRRGYPSPLNYRGFPKSVCTSVNEVICHGIPDSRQLAEGDIINIDVTIYLDGVHGDTSATFCVGEVDPDSLRLVTETRHALDAGIAAVRPGAPVNAIGRAIENHARQHRLGVVRDFIGHGIGTEFHSGLAIPHYFDRRATRELEVGMSFTIEPMLTLGTHDLYVWDDGWTAVTADGRRTAQFEHTLICTEDGVEVVTQTSAGTTAHEVYAV
ncbi:MAG: type I methionyl aminopeptidase [Acidimicrobiales bacterium]|nr:type I methionyl aminopeptidase [Acidimicrobiales bacterium]